METLYERPKAGEAIGGGLTNLGTELPHPTLKGASGSTPTPKLGLGASTPASPELKERGRGPETRRGPRPFRGAHGGTAPRLAQAHSHGLRPPPLMPPTASVPLP